MYRVYSGMVRDEALDESIRTELRKNGFRCADPGWRRTAAVEELEKEVASSDVFICYATSSAYGDLSYSEDMELSWALNYGVPVIVIRTDEYEDRCGGSSLQRMLATGRTAIFDMTAGAQVADLPEYAEELIRAKADGKGVSWFVEHQAPEAPYEGEQDFLFFSFAEEDRLKAYRIICDMQEHGYRVWYSGTESTKDREERIAELISRCGCLIALISPHYIESENCRDEIGLARDLNKERLLVYLEKTKLSPGMAMRLLRLQAIHKYTYRTRQEFYDKLYSAKGIGTARE